VQGVPDESQRERLNRNLDQLLQELRVALPGVQVLFAFLLAVPFASGFDRLDRVERVVFFVALLFAALAVVLLMAPSIQHRILFRHDQKHFLVHLGTLLAIAGMTSLACAMTLSVVLVADVLYGGVTVVAFGVIWYAIPIERRRHAGPARDDP
jgi:hypothetical protein